MECTPEAHTKKHIPRGAPFMEIRMHDDSKPFCPSNRPWVLPPYHWIRHVDFYLGMPCFSDVVINTNYKSKRNLCYPEIRSGEKRKLLALRNIIGACNWVLSEERNAWSHLKILKLWVLEAEWNSFAIHKRSIREYHLAVYNNSCCAAVENHLNFKQNLSTSNSKNIR